MPRLVHALTNEADWESVTLQRPCPVCSSTQGCSTHSRSFVSCERTPSQWPMTTGTWLHRVELTVHATTRAARPATPTVADAPARLPIGAALARAGTRA